MQPPHERAACWGQMPSITGQRLLPRQGSVPSCVRGCRCDRLGLHGLCNRGQTVEQPSLDAYGIVGRLDGQIRCETVKPTGTLQPTARERWTWSRPKRNRL